MKTSGKTLVASTLCLLLWHAPLASGCFSYHFITDAVTPAKDGVIAGGLVRPSRGDGHYWLYKVEPNGRRVMDIPDNGAQWRTVRAVSGTADGGFVAADDSCRYTDPKYPCSSFVRRFSKDGILLWERDVSGSRRNEAVAVFELEDGGFAYAGAGARYDNAMGVVHTTMEFSRLDGSGKVILQKAFDGRIYDMRPVPGGFLVAAQDREEGFGRVFTDSRDATVELRGADFERVWVKRLDREPGNPDRDYTVAARPAADGGVLAVVQTVGWFKPVKKGWLVRLDSRREIVWDRLIYEKDESALTDAAMLDDGGAIVSGVLRPDGALQGAAFVARVGADGKVAWRTVLGVAENCWGAKVVSSGVGYMAAFNVSPGSSGSETYTVWVGVDAGGSELWRRRLPEEIR